MPHLSRTFAVDISAFLLLGSKKSSIWWSQLLVKDVQWVVVVKSSTCLEQLDCDSGLIVDRWRHGVDIELINLNERAARLASVRSASRLLLSGWSAVAVETTHDIYWWTVSAQPGGLDVSGNVPACPAARHTPRRCISSIAVVILAGVWRSTRKSRDRAVFQRWTMAPFRAAAAASILYRISRLHYSWFCFWSPLSRCS